MNGLRTRVDAFVRRMKREDVCLHGFLLSKDNRPLARAYYAPFAEGQPHRMYSVSKTMTALAIGILIDEGKLTLDDRISDYFRDWLPQNPDGKLLRLTIRDMLRMSTCFMRTAYREGVDYNWAKPFFEVMPDHEPGTVFCYDTGCSQVLAELVFRLTGVQVIDFLEKRVFKPLCLKDERYWLRDPSGTCQGGTGLCMSLRDFDRTARAVMNGGEGVLPEWYCREMVKKHIGTEMQQNEEERYGYGWQCWQTRAGWAMYGMGGQLAVCCPEKGVMLSTIADTRLDPVGVQRIYNAFFDEVYPYIGNEDMEDTEYTLAVQAVENDSFFERTHTEKYIFDDNSMGITSLRLVDGGLEIGSRYGMDVLRFGTGKNEAGIFPGCDIPTLCSAGWLPDDKLMIRCFLIGDAPCGVTMLLSFKGEYLTLQCRRSADPAVNRFDGVITGRKEE